MTSDSSTAPHERVVDLELAAAIKRARIGLVLIGLLYACTAYGNYAHLRPWLDGSLLDQEPVGRLKALIDLAYFIIVFTGIASVANVVLAAIAAKRTTFAVCAATGIFAVYTALRLYQTDGRYLSDWLWWVTAIALGMGCRAAYTASQLRTSRQLASARVVT
jgi:hypothetical protein